MNSAEQKTDLSQLNSKLLAIKHGGGLTLRLRNKCGNESLIDFQRSFGASTTLFEAKTGRLPVVANYLRNTDFSLLQGLKNNENMQLKTAKGSSQIENLNCSRVNEKSVIENQNHHSNELTSDPLISQLLKKQFYPKTDMSPASEDQSDLELSQDQTEDFERETSPLLTYQNTETVKNRRVNNMPIRGLNLQENSGSKQAYFDKAKPIINAQEYQSNALNEKKKLNGIASSYQMEIDAFVADACLATSGREEFAKRNCDNSDGANRKVGVYLEKMRERNSSLQERLNLSFKSSSRLDSSSIAQRPTTSFQNVKWENYIDRSKCKSLNRGSAASSRQQAKTPNQLNLSLVRKQTESNEKDQMSEVFFQAKKAKIQLTQRTNPNFINISQMRPQPNKISENTKKQLFKIHVNNYANIQYDGDHAERATRQDLNLSNYFTQREENFEDINNSKTAAFPNVENTQITTKLASAASSSSQTPLQSFYQVTKVLQQLSKTSRPNQIVNKTNENRNKSSEFKQKNSYSSLIKYKTSNEMTKVERQNLSLKNSQAFQCGFVQKNESLEQRAVISSQQMSSLENNEFQLHIDSKMVNEQKLFNKDILSKAFWTQGVGNVQQIPQQHEKKVNERKKSKSKVNNSQSTQKQKKKGALKVRDSKNMSTSFSLQNKTSQIEEEDQRQNKFLSNKQNE